MPKATSIKPEFACARGADNEDLCREVRFGPLPDVGRLPQTVSWVGAGYSPDTDVAAILRARDYW